MMAQLNTKQAFSFTVHELQTYLYNANLTKNYKFSNTCEPAFRVFNVFFLFFFFCEKY